MPVCLCRKCRQRSVVKKGKFPGVCTGCNYILTADMIVDEPEEGSPELALRNYCERKGLNYDGQFIEEDGYLFTDGYLLGHEAALRDKPKAEQKPTGVCKPCNCGSCEQSRSDRSFYTKQLFKKASEFLKIDPENTSWFEVMDLMEKEIKTLRYDLQVAHSVINANKDQTNGKTD